MPADFRQVDEHGFPLPPQFSDLKYRDDIPERPKISPRAKRLALLAMIMGVITLVFGPQLFSIAREFAANWLADQAERKLLTGDYAGALAEYSRAIEWNPGDWQLYRSRAEVHLKMQDLAGSLADLTKIIELVQSHDDWQWAHHGEYPRSMILAETYTDRSMVFVRLNRSHEAIDDATQALNQAPQPPFLNGRAYVRALLNTELTAGLADVDLALANNREAQQKLRKQRMNLTGVDLAMLEFRSTELRANEAEYLDTRGYLLHLLDRNEEALKDLNRALHFQEQDEPSRRATSARGLEQALESQQKSLAVMYHHRGLIYEKLGRKDDAEQDRKRGDELGYNPDRGVF